MNCLLDAGLEKPIDTPVTRAVAVLVNRLYTEFATVGGCVGAGLHIVTDDYNVEDACLDYCESTLDTHWSADPREFGASRNDIASLIALEREIIAGLRPLSEHERLSAIELGKDR
jgi:hypothetical protein